MAKEIWFGIPNGRMQWVPAPLAGGAESRKVRHVESVQYENGGANVYRSKPYHLEYDFEFNRPLKGSEELGVFSKFASGFYGDGLVYFADPFHYETNLFAANWASPGLIEQGWKNISANTPTFSNTATNVYGQPIRSATFSMTGSAGAAPTVATQRFIIPVPPTHTLHFGWSGSVTGNGAVAYRPINTSGVTGSNVILTPLSATGATRMNASVSGATAQAVEFFLYRTATVASTVTVTSMMAQLWPTGTTPTLTGEHIPGEGHTGLEFADDANTESYVYLDPPRKALSTTLIEVGAWR